MSVLNTIYPKSFTWNSVTYNGTTGGTLRFEYQHEGTPFLDRTADDEYSSFVVITDKRLIVRVRLREVKYVTALGTKSDASIIITGKTNAATITFVGLVLVGASPGEQGRAEGGSVTLVFEHESADGTTVPIS